jgi:hypothetical protein
MLASSTRRNRKSDFRNRKEEKRMGKTILIALVVAIVVGGAAAFGGYKMGDTAGFARANQVRQQFAQGRQSTQGGATTGGGTGVGGNARGGFELQGVVKNIDGNTMTVTIGQRDVTVTVTDKTQFLKSVAGARADLAAGARVMVAPEGGAGGGAGGASAGGGSAVNAASVTILPAQ